MPTVTPQHFQAMQELFGWAPVQATLFLKQLWESDPKRKEWTEQEEKLLKHLRHKKISFARMSALFNRDAYLIAQKFNSWDEEKVLSTLEEDYKRKQSAGAAKLEKLILKYFGPAYKIQKEYAVYEVDRWKLLGYLDFYMPQKRLGFEFDGRQHQKFTKLFHKDQKGFKAAQRRDQIKEKHCAKRGIIIIRFSDTDPLNEENFVKKMEAIEWGSKRDVRTES